jgi:hypothetical protein
MPNIHVNAPIQVSALNQTNGAAVAESFFGGTSFAEQANEAIVQQAQQSSFLHQFVL